MSAWRWRVPAAAGIAVLVVGGLVVARCRHEVAAVPACAAASGEQADTEEEPEPAPESDSEETPPPEAQAEEPDAGTRPAPDPVPDPEEAPSPRPASRARGPRHTLDPCAPAPGHEVPEEYARLVAQGMIVVWPNVDVPFLEPTALAHVAAGLL